MKEFGTFETIWAPELPATESLDRIVSIYSKELAGLNSHEAHALIAEKDSRLAALAKVLSKYPPQKRNEAYRVAIQGIANIFNYVADRSDVVTLKEDWKPEAHFMSLVADNFEDSDKVILDAACGTGVGLYALANIFPDKLFVGYDIAERMIQKARQRMQSGTYSNTRLLVADETSLPLNDKSVDVTLVMHPAGVEGVMPQHLLFPKGHSGVPFTLAKNLSETRRVLKDDGALITLQYLLHPGGRNLPGFDYKGSVVWSETETFSGKPFSMAFFYRKSK